MSPWVKLALPAIGKSLSGGYWQDVIAQVRRLGDSTLSGAEKRQRVKDFLVESGCDLASFLMNLVIEIAVAWLAAQGALPLKD